MTLTGERELGSRELETGTVGRDITEDDEEGNLRLVTWLLLPSLMMLLLLSILLLCDDVETMLL